MPASAVDRDVAIVRDADVTVAQPLRDNLDRYAGFGKQRGVRVAEIVETDAQRWAAFYVTILHETPGVRRTRGSEANGHRPERIRSECRRADAARTETPGLLEVRSGNSGSRSIGTFIVPHIGPIQRSNPRLG